MIKLEKRQKNQVYKIIEFISMKRNLRINNISILLLLFVFVLYSCNKSNIHISDKMIKEIASINDENKDNSVSYIPEVATNLLYSKLTNGKIVCTNALELESVYIDYYKDNYKTYYDFLTETLNQRININPNQIQKMDIIVFELDKSVLNKSNDMIKREYFERNGKIYSFYSKKMSLDQKQTILYKMFIDNYLISFDDYDGKYIITKYE